MVQYNIRPVGGGPTWYAAKFCQHVLVQYDMIATLELK